MSRRDFVSFSLIWTALRPGISPDFRTCSAAVEPGGSVVAKDRYVYRSMAAMMERVAARIPMMGKREGDVNVRRLETPSAVSQMARRTRHRVRIFDVRRLIRSVLH